MTEPAAAAAKPRKGVLVGAALFAASGMAAAGFAVGQRADTDPAATTDGTTVVTLTVDVERGLPLCDAGDQQPAGWTGGCVFRRSSGSP